MKYIDNVVEWLDETTKAYADKQGKETRRRAQLSTEELHKIDARSKRRDLKGAIGLVAALFGGLGLMIFGPLIAMFLLETAMLAGLAAVLGGTGYMLWQSLNDKKEYEKALPPDPEATDTGDAAKDEHEDEDADQRDFEQKVLDEMERQRRRIQEWDVREQASKLLRETGEKIRKRDAEEEVPEESAASKS